MGRYEEALADFNRALELEPEEDWCHYNRALVHRAMGRENQARIDLTAAIARAQAVYTEKPQDWSNTFNLALYHLAAGEPVRAEQLYQEALIGGEVRRTFKVRHTSAPQHLTPQ